MNELFLRGVALNRGLGVTRRVTTGDERAGFATFELFGDRNGVLQAWEDIKPVAAGAGMLKDGFASLKASDVDGSLYVECQSVWFETL